MQIGLSSQDISQAEIDAVVGVLKSSHLSLGPKLPEFESILARYVGRKYGVAVNSGTSALHLAMIALGIGPGDEVITTPFSFIATTNIVLMVGATPVFVDIDEDTYNIDVSQIEAKITPKTRALLPVEVFGNPKGLDKVCDLAKKHDLLCIEDSCEALGSVVNSRKAGTLGDVSFFAFYPNKQMTTGEGGMVVTDDENLAAMCKSLRNQGRDEGAGWLAHARLGYNFRLSDINCAIGVEQVKRMDSFIEKRRNVAKMYQEALGDDSRLILPYEPEGCLVSWFVYVVRLQDSYTQEHRDKVLESLRAQGIGCSNYFSPIHLQPFIAEKLGTRVGQFPVTEKVAQRTIAIPFHNNITREQVDVVSNALSKSLDSLGEPGLS
ncbi:MAG: DegT/DnrJ/EryC1/StrS family aminotransferase [Phycisphaerae bacterium]|nr:DegT/DnrJ/EryC1/StrS family aminotransferase [Phycisphaerae bacterium]